MPIVAVPPSNWMSALRMIVAALLWSTGTGELLFAAIAPAVVWAQPWDRSGRKVGDRFRAALSRGGQETVFSAVVYRRSGKPEMSPCSRISLERGCLVGRL